MTIEAAALGALGAIGAILVVATMRGLTPAFALDSSGLDVRPAASRLDGRRLLTALVGLLGAWFLTGWPVIAGYGALAGYLFPLFGESRRQRREAIDRVEAIAVWVEGLRDRTAAGSSPRSMLLTSAAGAPTAIQAEVQELARNIDRRSVEPALRQFAASVRHPLADTVAASILMSIRQGGDIKEVLGQIAREARDYANLWRQVEAGRAKIYTQTRIATLVSSLFVVYLILASRDYLEPFDRPEGSIALLVIGGIFFASGVTFYRLGRAEQPERMFDGVEVWGVTSVTVEEG